MNPEEDDFDTAWDEDDTQVAEGEGDNEDAPGDDPDGDHSDSDTESDSHETSEQGGEGDDRGEEAGENDALDPAELKAQLEKTEQRMKSWEGRLSSEARERERLARENEELKKRLDGSGQQPAGNGPEQDTDASQTNTDGPDQDTAGNQDELATIIEQDFGPEMRQYLDKRARDIAAEQQQGATSQLGDRLAPLEQAYQEMQVQQHWERIIGEHPDAEELAQSDEFQQWIDEQPAFLANSMRQVAEGGTADDVVQLLTQYKQAKQQPSTPRQPGARAVRSRSGGPPKRRAAAEDFDSAWDQF